ncbi:hypothetical protein BJX96DRAFT_157901 [Aspergillus floccosus]
MGETSPETPAQSHLERLPVELIEQIFLHSLEFNLPRASPHLARVLSTPLLYTWLIRLAFSSPNESSKCDFFTPDFLPYPLDVFALSATQRRDLQNNILVCRWCTLYLLRKCQREYVARILRLRCYNTLDVPAADDRRILSTYLADSTSTQPPTDPISTDIVLSARDPRTNTSYKVTIWPAQGAVHIRHANRRSIPTPHSHPDTFRLPWCAADAPPRIPDKLLEAPWCAEKLALLEMLAAAGAYVDEDDLFGRSRRALRLVIRARDYATFERLLGVEVRTAFYKYPAPWPVQGHHFRVAMKYAEGKEDPFLRRLVETRWQDLKDDELKCKLMQWVES